MKLFLLLLVLILSTFFKVDAQPIIYVNQVAYDAMAVKTAVISTNKPLQDNTNFFLTNTFGKTVFEAALGKEQQINEWLPDKYLYVADFSKFKSQGNYRISLKVNGKIIFSLPFKIGKELLAKLTIPAIAHYYHKQRANTPQELAADSHLPINGSNKTVDMRGGWCDASGDVSKYFSHLAYANFMSPQQTGLVTWSLASTVDKIPQLLQKWGIKDSIEEEALWGADYMMRSLSDSNFFYMVVFSYFNNNPQARKVVGLEANSVTTSDYQCAFREGAGMAIAALARISRWKKHGDFTTQQYLKGAELAFKNLLVNNLKYDDNHQENIIDDYCALVAASELWIATGKNIYKSEARKRARNLNARMNTAGYFIADNRTRIYWHASDAGLPIVALARYLDVERDKTLRKKALLTIKSALDYNLRITHDVDNPFGYARQTFDFHGKIKEGFFIPHDNISGWWWQGEDARLASLATAAIIGGRLVYPAKESWGIRKSVAEYASQQLSWILGCNPYQMCFMYGFGENNVPYMHSNYGHGSEHGGISNGITGKQSDGSGIEFKLKDKGNEWRWTEQWIPHAAWFLQAVAAIAEEHS
ncbi:glycoside hydrolase family 9 protein [Arachidicoccus soli]|uniref:Glycosyl transferase n=1 Tax=Arachidicoccus soli TaxID=2341117 RepID=A0A386HKM7_9BACT|nr:glycoside hydrolase family 9 protein [Arachidicoccus soli]AYD46457.1 glycosyl transferase [Arachidicoccus soli]